jgi:F0F1-type ATP synthase membrane subunit c/vacuolar-type H+-ATPase subunit K
MAKGALGPAVGAGVCASAETQLATRKTTEQTTLVIIA